MYDSVLGIIPLSAYRSAPPVIVNVLPDPVCNTSSSLVQYIKYFYDSILPTVQVKLIFT